MKKSVEIVLDAYIDGLIFEEIINFCRIEYGYPGCKEISTLLETYPVIPKAEFFLPCRHSLIEEWVCPKCKERVHQYDFTYHLASCTEDLSPENGLKICEDAISVE